MKRKVFSLITCLSANLAFADEPFRQLYSPALSVPATADRPSLSEDFLAGSRPRSSRWDESIRWFELETDMSDTFDSLTTNGDCVEVREAFAEVLATIRSERNFFVLNCVDNLQQLRSCVSSQLRLANMAHESATLKADVSTCRKSIDPFVIRNRINGKVATGIEGRSFHLLETKKFDTKAYPEFLLNAEGEYRLNENFGIRSTIDTTSQWYRSQVTGLQQGSGGIFYDSGPFALSLQSGIASERGFFDTTQDSLNSERRWFSKVQTTFRLTGYDYDLHYEPELIISPNRVYSGVRQQFRFSVRPKVDSGDVGYVGELRIYRKSSDAVYPDWSSARFSFDLSQIFLSRKPGGRSLLLGLEERRDRTNEGNGAPAAVRLLPYFWLVESFGPLPGAAWLTRASGFAQTFDSSVHVSLAGEETRLSPTNQTARAEGELRLLGQKFKLPLRLGFAWNRAFFSQGNSVAETFMYKLGVYPQLVISGRLSVEFEAEYRRELAFDRRAVDARFWIYPYENFDKAFFGLRSRYDF